MHETMGSCHLLVIKHMLTTLEGKTHLLGRLVLLSSLTTELWDVENEDVLGNVESSRTWEDW